jgi:hypothetical protein
VSEIEIISASIAAVVVLASVISYLYATHTLNSTAQKAVSAAYKVGIGLAANMCEDGVEWLRSDESKEFRRQIAVSAYCLLPVKIGPIPVGLIKVVITEDRFCAIVQHAFDEMAELAEQFEQQLETAAAMPA